MKTGHVRDLSTEEIQREIARLEGERVRASAALDMLRRELDRRLLAICQREAAEAEADLAL